MASLKRDFFVLFFMLVVMCSLILFIRLIIPHKSKSQTISFNVSKHKELHKISPLFLGAFVEEINHALTGGLWSELVSNRGFEAGGHSIPAMISPWDVIGNAKDISIATELVSCFETNPMALRIDIHCNLTSCPQGGVGIYNPGYWGMNIHEGHRYKVVFYVKSSKSLDVTLAFASEDGKQVLASRRVMVQAKKVENWTKMKITLKANQSYATSRLQLTTNQNAIIWLDQVSAMPYDTYKGHGFRTDLVEMISRLQPRFLRFPGGAYVEGYVLNNAFRWKATIGPWEKRPGHVSFWGYWTDDGLGFLEYLQLAEDLGVEPVWVVNCGISYRDEADTSLVEPFVQEMLDGIEFARGSSKSRWGSLRAKLGHPTPFSLKFIAIGNDNCNNQVYKGNYLKFHNALMDAYPDVKVISNCNGLEKPLDHPADLYDVHIYASISNMLQLAHLFEKSRRDPPAPKAFVSQYSVLDPLVNDQNETFKGALAEAAFLLSLEQNSDLVDMVSYSPMFVNQHDPRWKHGAINFNSNRVYGIASYWVQTFFKETSGAILMKIDLHNQKKLSNVYITAIKWTDWQHKKYIKIKVVNFNSFRSKLKINFNGFEPNSTTLKRKIEFASSHLQIDNTFANPTKVVPVSSLLDEEVRRDIDLVVQPYSFTSFDVIYK